MKQARRCRRILILSLLCISVITPIVFVSQRIKSVSNLAGDEETMEELPGIKHGENPLKLTAIQQEEGEGVRVPEEVVYKDLSSAVSFHSSNKSINFEKSANAGGQSSLPNINGTNHKGGEENNQIPSKMKPIVGEKTRTGQTTIQHDHNLRSHSRRSTDENLRQMRDQVIRAKAYLNFAPPGSKSHLVKELRLRIRELERAVGDANKDSDLSRSAIQKSRSMESSLLKAGRIYPDCSAMAVKLRAMTTNAEEQVRVQKAQASYLLDLAAKTKPKGLHCLAMRLTAEYFALQPEKRQLPSQQKLHDTDLYHYAIFSDNVLASAVVVSSTVSAATKHEKIVFHVVTSSLYFPAISMWFILNPPGKAAIQIQRIEDFKWLSSKYNSTLRNQNPEDSRFKSSLNHLRFYLPDVFPELDKIVLLDHDVVVQRDLTKLWSVDMKGKVNAAVETCRENETSFSRMDRFINFSYPFVAKRFDVNACTWAFGMNLFDLQQWRRRNLTTLYHRYLQLGNKRASWKPGSLPLGWMTFYNQTIGLDRQWHALGLGNDDSGGRDGEIEQAAVIHYDGAMKPWTDIAVGRYKHYWSRHVNYEHPYLQHCNIHR